MVVLKPEKVFQFKKKKQFIQIGTEEDVVITFEGRGGGSPAKRGRSGWYKTSNFTDWSHATQSRTGHSSSNEINTAAPVFQRVDYDKVRIDLP